MRRLLLMTSMALCACAKPTDPEPVQGRALQNIVKVCVDGTIVGRDPMTHQYAFYKRGGAFFDAGAAIGVLPASTNIKEFCS